MADPKHRPVNRVWWNLIVLLGLAIFFAALCPRSADANCPTIHDPVEADDLAAYEYAYCDQPGESICLGDWLRAERACRWYCPVGLGAIGHDEPQGCEGEWQVCPLNWIPDPADYDQTQEIWVKVRARDLEGLVSENWSEELRCEPRAGWLCYAGWPGVEVPCE